MRLPRKFSKCSVTMNLLQTTTSIKILFLYPKLPRWWIITVIFIRKYMVLSDIIWNVVFSWGSILSYSFFYWITNTSQPPLHPLPIPYPPTPTPTHPPNPPLGPPQNKRRKRKNHQHPHTPALLTTAHHPCMQTHKKIILHFLKCKPTKQTQSFFLPTFLLP